MVQLSPLHDISKIPSIASIATASTPRMSTRRSAEDGDSCYVARINPSGCLPLPRPVPGFRREPQRHGLLAKKKKGWATSTTQCRVKMQSQNPVHATIDCRSWQANGKRSYRAAGHVPHSTETGLPLNPLEARWLPLSLTLSRAGFTSRAPRYSHLSIQRVRAPRRFSVAKARSYIVLPPPRRWWLVVLLL